MTLEQALAALQKPDPLARWRAVRWLRVLGGPDAVAALIEAVDDPDPNGSVPAYALIGLGQIRAREAVPVLMERFQNRPNSPWRPMYAETLGQIGDPEVVPALIEALDNPEDTVVRNAVDALGAIGDRSALPFLIARLGASDERTVKAACAALASLDDPDAVEPLMRLPAGPGWGAREAACEALFELGVTDERLRAALTELAQPDEQDSPAPQIRSMILEAQAAIARRDAARQGVSEIAPAASLEPERAVRVERHARELADQHRRHCRWMLRELEQRRAGGKDEGAGSEVEDELHEDEPGELEAALADLGDADPGSRRAAADRLGRLSAPEAAAALVRALEDPDAWNRRNVARWLGSREVPGAAAALIDHLLRDESADMRGMCAWMLETYPGEQVTDTLRRALADPDPGVVLHVCRVLAGREDRESIPLLLALLEHRDRRNRLSAARARLALNVADERLLGTLERLARDPEADEHDLEALEFNAELDWRREMAVETGEPEPQPWLTMAQMIEKARQQLATAAS